MRTSTASIAFALAVMDAKCRFRCSLGCVLDEADIRRLVLAVNAGKVRFSVVGLRAIAIFIDDRSSESILYDLLFLNTTTTIETIATIASRICVVVGGAEERPIVFLGIFFLDLYAGVGHSEECIKIEWNRGKRWMMRFQEDSIIIEKTLRFFQIESETGIVETYLTRQFTYLTMTTFPIFVANARLRRSESATKKSQYENDHMADKCLSKLRFVIVLTDTQGCRHPRSHRLPRPRHTVGQRESHSTFRRIHVPWNSRKRAVHCRTCLRVPRYIRHRCSTRDPFGWYRSRTFCHRGFRSILKKNQERKAM